MRARFPDVALPADGHRHDAGPRQPRAGLGRVPLGQGADPAGHADDRQGARFSQRHAGGRDQCRHGPAPARLPRRRADLSPGHAGGRPDRPGRQGAAGCWCRRSAPTIRRSRPAVRHDYAAFAAGELPIRQMLRYPPFASDDPAGGPRAGRKPVAVEFAQRLARAAAAALEARQADARVLGPAPCPFARLRGKYRFQIQIQGPDGEQLRAAPSPRPRPSSEPPERRAVDRGRDPVEICDLKGIRKLAVRRSKRQRNRGPFAMSIRF